MADHPSDPILEVCGVPSAVILQRCAAVREGKPSPIQASNAAAASPEATTAGAIPSLAPGRTSWRLVDFADLTDEEFTVAAHIALLGRPAHAREVVRRTADLAAGMTRIEVIARLVFHPEGRRAQKRAIGGLALPAMAGIARLLDLGRPRGRTTGGAPSAAEGRRLAALADWLWGLRQIGRMQRELIALRQELEDLRRGGPK